MLIFQNLLLGLLLLSVSSIQCQDQPVKKNHLSKESSAYLLQHSENPIDWYPWGNEALEKAKNENKPIFLSIGYRSCHWCHVMENESFKNEEIAKILNEHFVSIKVDREERPDIDKVYMTVVQMITDGGGWPLNVFLTPDLKPFYGGTYFPPKTNEHGPGFQDIITKISEGWQKEQGSIKSSAELIVLQLKELQKRSDFVPRAVEKSIMNKALQDLSKEFDHEYGGFGAAPKFPSINSIRFLLMEAFEKKDENILKMATVTLDKMMQGGLYDQLAGGFHRYSVDEKWLVPHFEKMLYDNGQLLATYAEAYQLTKKEEYLAVVTQTAEFLLRKMKDPRGYFYSSIDADTNHQEGMTYLWQFDEIKKILNDEEFQLICKWFSLQKGGNFPPVEKVHQGLNILHGKFDQKAFLEKYAYQPELFAVTLENAKTKLLAARQLKAQPFLDKKLVISWNALAINGFAKAYQATLINKYKDAAKGALDDILKNLWIPNKGLFKEIDQQNSMQNAVLDDYAYLIESCMEVYQITFDENYLQQAILLQKKQDELFFDKNIGTYLFAHHEEKNLLIKQTPIFDDTTPNGNSITAKNLLFLYHYTLNKEYLENAKNLIKNLAEPLYQVPMANLKLLEASSILINGAYEVVVVLPSSEKNVQAALTPVYQSYLPRKMIAFRHWEGDVKKEDTYNGIVEILKEKRVINNKIAYYLCVGDKCLMPQSEWKGVEKLVEQNRLIEKSRELK